MTIIWPIVLILFFSFILIKAADQVVIALRRLSKLAHAKTFTLSAILLALATSFPELSVAVTSALEGAPSLSLGNVLGANIANISLVAGLATVLAGRVTVHGEFLRKDIGIALFAGILPLILLYDKSLSRVDGLILLAVYGAYSTSLFKVRFQEIANIHAEESFIRGFFRTINHVNIKEEKTRELGRLFLAIAALLFSANMVVHFARELAVAANIPVFLVGLVLLSIGTTLPELAFSVRSLFDGEPTMFFGNLLGSIIANSTLILGVASVIAPIKVEALSEVAVAAGTFVVVYLLFWIFIRSKMHLERWEAIVLLVLYILFVAVEFLL